MSSLTATNASFDLTHAPPSPTADVAAEELTTKEAFRDFVAGTFYRELFKSLRSGENKPAYFHGGRAEEIFRGQLDQIVTEDLAKSHGAQLSDPLFSAFSRYVPGARAADVATKSIENSSVADSVSTPPRLPNVNQLPPATIASTPHTERSQVIDRISK